jgi:SAM-dependent methyltransferase
MLAHLPTPIREFSQKVADWPDIQLMQLRKALRRQARQARGRLLDVGCGNRPFEPLFRPYVDEYVGLEHAAAFAKTSASLDGQGPDFVYDGGRMPFEDASFDTVLSIQVLEHTADPGVLITEMARVLRPGGVLLLTAPFSYRLHEEPHDYFRYTPHGLRHLCEQANLTVREVEPFGGLFQLLGHKLNAYLAFRVARLDRLGQQMGRLTHEAPALESMRLAAVPLVVPALFAIAGSARLLDAMLPDPTETLGFALVADRK